jgi:hypothetical protein
MLRTRSTVKQFTTNYPGGLMNWSAWSTIAMGQDSTSANSTLSRGKEDTTVSGTVLNVFEIQNFTRHQHWPEVMLQWLRSAAVLTLPMLVVAMVKPIAGKRPFYGRVEGYRHR